MFGGRDPFDMFGEMHSQMRQMDQMMNQMMDPFGLLGGGLGGRPSPFGMIEAPGGHRGGAALSRYRDPFGFPDIFSQYGPPPPPPPPYYHRHRHHDLYEPPPPFARPGFFRRMHQLAGATMNDPNSVCFTQSTVISMDGSGRPRIVEQSTRKSGDVKETRRHLRHGDQEEMTIGHSIGDREHVMEKKRDKDGKMRSEQRFRNLDESEARDFDREFATRAERNMRDPFGMMYGRRTGGPAIEERRGTSSHSRHLPSASSSSRRDNAPIITLPDDDDEPIHQPSNSSTSHGPIIREISEEEAEQSIPKRRKDMFGRFRVGDQ